jgi:hypothetical protein
MRKHKRQKMLASCILIIIYIVLKMYVFDTLSLKDDPTPDINFNLLTTVDETER